VVVRDVQAAKGKKGLTRWKRIWRDPFLFGNRKTIGNFLDMYGHYLAGTGDDVTIGGALFTSIQSNKYYKKLVADIFEDALHSAPSKCGVKKQTIQLSPRSQGIAVEPIPFVNLDLNLGLGVGTFYINADVSCVVWSNKKRRINDCKKTKCGCTSYARCTMTFEVDDEYTFKTKGWAAPFNFVIGVGSELIAVPMNMVVAGLTWDSDNLRKPRNFRMKKTWKLRNRTTKKTVCVASE